MKEKLIIINTKEDLIKYYKIYKRKIGLKTKFSQCIFQDKRIKNV